MEDKRTLGEYIAQRRRALGMTQRQFAEKLYVTDSAVSKWERGLSYPDITLLHDICRVLEVSEHPAYIVQQRDIGVAQPALPL